MSAWTAIALTDLNDYLVGVQVNAINTAARATGQTDRFTRIMTDVVNEMRVTMESNYRNYVSATPLTVPPELKWVACYKIIARMQTAIPGLTLSDDQVRELEKAETKMTRIADRKEVISKADDPQTPSDVQRGGQIRVVSQTKRRFKRCETGGL